MIGTDKARACDVCGRHVHDLTVLTSSEAERLLDSRGERLCIRFSRGPDGKIITADRPPRFAMPRRPIAGLSIAALAAFFVGSQPRVTTAAVAAQPTDACRETAGGQVETGEAYIAGIIHDQSGTVLIPDATVWALSELTGGEYRTRSGELGTFTLTVPGGRYTVGVTSPGFTPFAISGVKVKSGENSKLDITIELPILGESFLVFPDVPPPSLIPACPEHRSFAKALTAPFRALKRLFGG